MQHKGAASSSSQFSCGDTVKSGSASDTDIDFTTAIVVDEDGKHKALANSSSQSLSSLRYTRQQQQQQQQQHRVASDSAATLSDADKDAEVLPGGHPAALVSSSSSGGLDGAATSRKYYVDWLRVFLTVLVIVHHCVCAYQTSYVWAAKKGDTALFLFSELFVNGNQAYFMALFFFLSGLYVPGSYRRKGTGKFLLDRTLRLVLPCLVYSFLAPPIILWWNEMAKQPGSDPGATLAAQFKAWLKPKGWPTTYILPTGPPWFVWMLWCFNVAYVVVKEAMGSEWLLPRCITCLCSNDQRLPNRVGKRETTAYTTRQMLKTTSALTALLFATCYAARLVDTFVFNVRPLVFVQRGPFVSFMPDLFPTYAIAFVLGIYSGPSGWNVLAKLPDSWGSWGLWVGGIWWVWAGWLPNIVLRPQLTLQKGATAFVLSWLLRTLVEQSFCVVWSVGLLVVFRRAFNAKPRLFGQFVINGAYGAYLVHAVVLIFFARVIMSYSLPSAVVNAAVISVPSVVTSWLLAVALRMIPGAHHVL